MKSGSHEVFINGMKSGSQELKESGSYEITKSVSMLNNYVQDSYAEPQHGLHTPSDAFPAFVPQLKMAAIQTGSGSNF